MQNSILQIIFLNRLDYIGTHLFQLIHYMIQSLKPQPSRNLLTLGTDQFPINILDDDQEKSKYNQLLERSRNEEIIKRAYLCKNSLQITFAIVKTKFPGQIAYKQAALKNKIAQYFYDKTGVNILYDYFLPKLEPDYSDEQTKPLGIALMVYGVDFMDTRQIGNMFSIPNEGGNNLIHKITWINDSNCKVTFFSPQNTQMVIQRLSKDFQQYKVKIQENGVTQLPRGWFQLKPYNIYDIPRKLFARYATTLELDIQKEEKINRYIGFQNAQKELQLSLLTQFMAFEQYHQIKKQIQFQSYRRPAFHQNRYFSNMQTLTDTRGFEEYISQAKQLGNGQNGFVNSLKPSKKQQPSSQNELNLSFICDGAQVVAQRKQLNSSIQANGQAADLSMVDESVQQPNQTILNASILKQLNMDNVMNEQINVLPVAEAAIMIEESDEIVFTQLVNNIEIKQTENKIQVQSQMINDDIVNLLKKPKQTEESQRKQPAISVSSINSDKYKLVSQLISFNAGDITVNQSKQQKLTIKSTEKIAIPASVNIPTNQIINKPAQKAPEQIIPKPVYQPVQVQKPIQKPIPKPVEKQIQKIPEKPTPNKELDYNPIILQLGNNQANKHSEIQDKTQNEPQQQSYDRPESNNNRGSNNTRGRGRDFGNNRGGYQGGNNGTRFEQNDGNSKGQGGNFNNNRNNQGANQRNQNKASLPGDDHYEPSSY